MHEIKRKEDFIKKIQKNKLNPRHSRFVGTYVATNLKSIHDKNDQIYHNQITELNGGLDLLNKKKKSKLKKDHTEQVICPS